MEHNRFPIRAYNKVWQIENRIYGILNYVLPVPIRPREAGYFMVLAGVLYLLGALIPALTYLPSVLRFLILPILLTRFFARKKLDGKPPQRYFLCWLRYQWTRGDYLERFQTHPSRARETLRLDWCCTQGNPKARRPNHVPVSH